MIKTQNRVYTTKEFGSLDLSKTGIIVADTSAFIRSGRLVEMFISDCKSLKNPPLVLIPQEVLTEGSNYRNGAHNGEAFPKIEQLVKSGRGIIVDVESLKPHSSILSYELDTLLPALSQLTVKSLLDQHIHKNPYFFSTLSRIVEGANFIYVEDGGFTHRRKVTGTTNELISLIEYYSGDSQVEGENIYSVEENQINIIEDVFTLTEYFNNSFDINFNQAIQELESSLSFSIDIDLLNSRPVRQNGKFRPYIDALREQYSNLTISIFQRLIFEGLYKRIKFYRGVEKGMIDEELRREYRQRFGPPSLTDMVVSSVYAWPLDKIDIDPNLLYSSKIKIITRDSDIEQLTRLRRDYTILQ